MNTRLLGDGFADRFLWSRHANPWSVWTLVVAYPTLMLAVYRRRWSLLLGTLSFVAVNPLVFSEPDDDSAWATRVVLGEKVWLEEGILSSPLDALFVALTAPIHLWTIRSAVNQRPVRTTIGTALSLLSMLLFFGRMVALYEESEQFIERDE